MEAPAGCTALALAPPAPRPAALLAARPASCSPVPHPAETRMVRAALEQAKRACLARLRAPPPEYWNRPPRHSSRPPVLTQFWLDGLHYRDRSKRPF